MYEDPQPYTNKKISIHIKKERGDFSICPFHDVKALALPCQSETSNADTTPKAPRQCKYIESTLDNEQWNRPKPMRAVYNTPHEAFFVALFLTCR